ncbi:hypothetical protein, partial [Corynebacterium striatum]|uniref:hypothetical protein n=1 Tax=Corynebacterium striatum TaxID=43770 RepID=UPI003D7AC2D8
AGVKPATGRLPPPRYPVPPYRSLKQARVTFTVEIAGHTIHAQTDLPADIRELTEKLPQPSD